VETSFSSHFRNVTPGSGLYSKVTVIAKTSGSITLKAGHNAVGGAFVPVTAAQLNSNVPEDSPYNIPDCP
jgi:hypothetical protein